MARATSTTNVTSDPENDEASVSLVGEPVGEAARATFAVIGSIMILSGVVGNASLLLVVVKNFVRNRRRALQDLFIVNLTVGSLLTMGYWFVFLVLDVVLGYHPVANESQCTANGMIICVLYMVNINSTLSIWFNRYLHVCHYHLCRRVFTLARTVSWCFLTWVFGLLLSLPPLWVGPAGHFTFSPKTHACSYRKEAVTYIMVMFILYGTSSLTLIIYFNVAIFRFWRQARLSLKRRYPPGERQQQRTRPLAAIRKAWVKRKNSVPGTLATEMTLEPETRPHHHHHQSPTDLAALSLPPVDISLPTQQAGTLLRNTGRTAPSGDDASGRGTVTPKLQLQVTTNDLNIDESRNLSQSEGGCSGDESEDRQEEACVSLGTEGGRSDSSEFRDQSQTRVEDAELTLGDRAEETDGCGSAAAGGSGSSAPSIPPSGLTPGRQAERRASSRRRKQQRRQRIAALNQRRRLRKNSRDKEAAFVRSLVVVCVLKFLSFTPYTVVLVFVPYAKQPAEVYIAVTLILFLNDAVSWVVYGVLNPTFKDAYVNYIRRVFDVCRRTKAWFPSPTQ